MFFMREPTFHPRIELTRTSLIPLSLQIANQLRHEIRRHRVAAGTRIVSERYLSDALSVSRNTVHQAYLQLADEGYITLPEMRGSYPRISGDAASKYRQPYPTINLVLPNRMSEYVGMMRRRSLELVAGLMDHAADLGISVKITPLPSKCASSKEISLWLDSFISRTLGVITLGSPNGNDPSFDALLQQNAVPHIFVSGRSTFSHIGSVTVDYAPGVRKMLQHLGDCSHRRLLLVDLPFPPVSTFANCACERVEVIQKLAGEYGVETRTVIWKGAKSSLEEVIGQIKSPWAPTAMWLHNDLLADELLPLLEGLGVRLFQDLSVVGYDDCSQKYALSSLNHSRQAMAAMAVDFVDNLFKHGKPGEAQHGRVPCEYFCKASVVCR
jgi:GntR family transcriptional regulator of arabinose operon